MSNVLLVAIVYEPDTVSTATIAAGLARQLHRLGHEVGVLTSVPHFNPPPTARKTRRRLITRTVEDGITVIRCHVHRKRPQLWLRAVDLAAFHAILAVAALRHVRKPEVTIVISPPFTLAFIGMLVRALGRGRLIYNAQELWPDVPRDLGVITNRQLLAVMSALEKAIYRRADHVVPIGPRFASIIVGRGARPERVTPIPNFVDTNWITPTSKDNGLSRAWGLASTPVVLYAGNIGLTQDFESLLAAAPELAEHGIHVVIVGDGAGRPTLEAQLAQLSLPNVRLEDFRPPEEVADLYGLADAVVVPLKRGHDRTTTPSKIFSAMAARRPLVVAATPDTDLAETVVESEAGVVVPPEDPAALADALIELLEVGAERRWNSDSAHRAARDHSPAAIGARYDALVARLSRRPAVGGAPRTTRRIQSMDRWAIHARAQSPVRQRSR